MIQESGILCEVRRGNVKALLTFHHSIHQEWYQVNEEKGPMVSLYLGCAMDSTPMGCRVGN